MKSYCKQDWGQHLVFCSAAAGLEYLTVLHNILAIVNTWIIRSHCIQQGWTKHYI